VFTARYELTLYDVLLTRISGCKRIEIRTRNCTVSCAVTVWVTITAGLRIDTFRYERKMSLKTQWSLCLTPVQHPTILCSAHTLYLCVLYGSQNKQRLFPYTAVTDWF
jgi:hypothetical protein